MCWFSFLSINNVAGTAPLNYHYQRIGNINQLFDRSIYIYIHKHTTYATYPHNHRTFTAPTIFSKRAYNTPSPPLF